jgi:hypothetical protein
MTRLLNLLLILFTFNQLAKAQINLDNVSLISITDRININYEKVNSYTFEIKFEDSIELWHLKQISRAEFQQGIFKQKADSLYSDLLLKGEEIKNQDSLKQLFSKRSEFLEDAYLSYCDTVKAKFIKYIPENVIIDLLIGLQDSTYDEIKFITTVELDDEFSYGNSIHMTSYYPLLGMTIYSSTGDTLVVYNDGQQDLMIPWNNKTMDTELYNPIINWSLDAILPEEMNYNKKRLTNGIKK